MDESNKIIHFNLDYNILLTEVYIVDV